MGVRFPSVFTNSFIGPLPANATETIVFTTPPLNIMFDSAPVFLLFACDLTPGATVTQHTFILRRGALVTSPSIMVSSLARRIVTPNRDVGSGCYFDLPGAAAGLQYTLTIQQVGATGAGSFLDGSLLAFSL